MSRLSVNFIQPCLGTSVSLSPFYDHVRVDLQMQRGRAGDSYPVSTVEDGKRGKKTIAVEIRGQEVMQVFVGTY